jgi:hypothetical protein
MASKIQAYVDAIGAQQTTDASGMAAYRLSLYTAMSQGIIDEIKQNARCSGNDSHGDSHDDVKIV